MAPTALFPEVTTEGEIVDPTTRTAFDRRFFGRYVSTRQFADIQALSGTNTDATSAIQRLIDTFEYVEIDGDFLMLSTKHLELDDYARWSRLGYANKAAAEADGYTRDTMVKSVRQTPFTTIRVGGPFTIRRRGGEMYGEVIGGTGILPERTKQFQTFSANPDGTPAVCTTGDWLYIASNDRQTGLDGDNYYGSIRQVQSINTAGRVLLNGEVNRTFTKGRKNYANARVAETTNVIKVDLNDDEPVTVGQVVDIYGLNHTLRASARTITAINAAPITAQTITVSGSAIAIQLGDYLVKTNTSDGHAGRPWFNKIDMLPPFTWEMGVGAEVIGRGFRSSSDDAALGASNTMFVFEHCLNTWILGQGTIGNNPRNAIQFSGCVGGGVGAGMIITRVWDSGTSGYLVNISGGCVGVKILATEMSWGRHACTSNVGGDMYTSFPEGMPTSGGDAKTYKAGYLQRDGSTSSTVKMGGVGEPEFCIYAPDEVAYCNAHGLDTHRPGFGFLYVIKNMHDNGGGVNIRSDQARVIGLGTITGAHDRSVVAVSEEVGIAPFLDGVKVLGLRADAGVGSAAGNEDYALFKFSAPFYAINCVAEGSSAPQGTAVFFDVGAKGDLVNFKVGAGITEAFRSRGTGVRVIDANIAATVSIIWTLLGAAVKGQNALISSNSLKTPAADGETWDLPDNVTASINASIMNAGQQYAVPFIARRGYFSSLAIGVEAAGTAGCTIKLAIYSSDVWGRITDNRVFGGTVPGDAIATQQYIPAAGGRVATMEGARYHVAAVALGGSPSVRRLQMGLGSGYTSLTDAMAQPGFQQSKTGATTDFITWEAGTGGSISVNSNAIKVLIGYSAKQS